MARRKKIQPGHWEPGYRSHHFWSENGKKIGSVVLRPLLLTTSDQTKKTQTVYHWFYGDLCGQAAKLRLARLAVESAHTTGLVQMDMFDLTGNVVEPQRLA